MAALRMVALKSIWIVCRSETNADGILPGHFIINGTRIPPSHSVLNPWNNGVLRPSSLPP